MIDRIRGNPVWRLLREIWREYQDDNLGDLAASTAFFTILSIPAGILALTSSLGYLGTLLGANLAADARQATIDLITRTFESQAGPLTRTAEELFDQPRSGLLTFSLAFALWAATRGFAALVRSLDAAYDIHRPRSWLDERLTALTMAMGSILTAAAGIWFSFVFWPRLGGGAVLRSFGWLIVVVFISLWAATMYHVGPNHRTPWRYDLPGAAATSIMWFALVQGFTIYVRISAGGNSALGAVGTALLAFTLIYGLSLAFLIGAELNAIIAQRAGVAQEPRRLRTRLATEVRTRVATRHGTETDALNREPPPPTLRRRHHR